MEQIVLINECRELLNSACERAETGHPDEAQVYLVKMRELLTEAPELEAGGDLRLEEKLNPTED